MEIEHHGFRFVSEHIGRHGRRIWPNAEFFCRVNLPKEWQDHIRMRSGGIQEEGVFPLGYMGRKWESK